MKLPPPKLPPDQITRLAQIVGAEFKIPAKLLEAMIYHESKGYPLAQGDAGEVGLMQLMPTTAEEVGVKREERTDPFKNVRGGARYLRKKYDVYGSWALALSAYNAGRPISGNVKNYVAPILKAAGMAGAGIGIGWIFAAIAAWWYAKRRGR